MTPTSRAPETAAPSRLAALMAAGVLVLTLSMGVGALVLIWASLRAGASLQAGAVVDSTAGQLLGGLTLGAGYALVGWLIASRRSDNPLGWVYLGIGLSQVGEAFVALAAFYGLVTAPGSIPGADVLSWIAIWAWDPGLTLLVSFSLLLFPTGRLPSPRWRPAAWLAVVMGVLLGVPGAIAGWPLRGPALFEQTGDIPGVLGLLSFLGFLLFVVVALSSVASIVIRFRRSAGLERQQLKWFTYAAIPVIAFVIVSGANVAFPGVVWLFAAVLITPLLPAAIGIAILRYRLYEIDRIISRTIGWLVMSAILGTVFVAVIVGLQAILAGLTANNTVAVAASTLVVAALFAPVRTRVQRAVDRRFHRARYDADRTAAAFAAHLQQVVDLETLRAELRSVIGGALQPSSTQVWVRHADEKGSR